MKLEHSTDPWLGAALWGSGISPGKDDLVESIVDEGPQVVDFTMPLGGGVIIPNLVKQEIFVILENYSYSVKMS